MIKLSTLYNRHMVREATSILADPSHSLLQEFHALISGWRYRVFRVRSFRAQGFFIPKAIAAINHKLWSTLHG